MKPIRCYTCGKILGNKWLMVERLQEEGIEMREIYERIGITRYCCKRVVLTTVDVNVMKEYVIPDNVNVNTTNPKSNFLKIT